MNSKFAYEIDFERNDMRENTYDFEELNYKASIIAPKIVEPEKILVFKKIQLE